jgi:1,4-alpha-glucan branching enzyme
MEYPYDPSWGYQINRLLMHRQRVSGILKTLNYLVDKLHQNDIGIILDWVPSHFPEDAHGLGFFDGSCIVRTPRSTKKGIPSGLEELNLQLRPQ